MKLCSPRRAHSDAGDLVRDAERVCQTKGERFEHVVVDDAQELDFAAASLVRALARRASPSRAIRQLE